MTADIRTTNGLICSVRESGDSLVVAIQGEVDLNNSPDLRAGLMQLLSNHKPRRLVVNLQRVPYMDSSAIAVLVELLRKIGRGGKMILTDLQPRVRGLLEIARLDSIFTLANTEQEATAKDNGL